MSTWENEDGLRVKFPLTSATEVTDGTSNGQTIKQLEVVIPGNALPAIATGGREDIAHLPANAFIVGAYAVATTGFGTDTGTLTIGLAKSDGTALDADGIDAAIDVSAVLSSTNDVVVCDGALVDRTERISERAWVYATNAGTITTGTVKLVLNYVQT